MIESGINSLLNMVKGSKNSKKWFFGHSCYTRPHRDLKFCRYNPIPNTHLQVKSQNDTPSSFFVVKIQNFENFETCLAPIWDLFFWGRWVPGTTKFFEQYLPTKHGWHAKFHDSCMSGSDKNREWFWAYNGKMML